MDRSDATPLLIAWLIAWLIASIASAHPARAQVIEPNGLQVPLSPPGSSEQSLQAYFAARMPPEPIDALRDASEEPGTFSPLCGFEAQLVLSESSAPAGLAWYEVPAEPRATPASIHPLLAETTQTGATLSSTAIRSDPSYRGGLVGFALTKGGVPIYYSEAARNVECTKCAMPGHWKMMLAYASRLQPNVYYLAWEDWEGAHDSGWPDDGDFNDKVFRLTGVRCAGGGEACDTGLPGQCAQGVTACASAGGSACNPLRPAQPERCDALDNDCNGVADEGTPCKPGEICKRGACVQACGVAEFVCPTAHVCEQGDCIPSACVGVQCDPGQLCRAGVCVAPCDGVLCAAGRQCSAGACVDPCAGAECGLGRMCIDGACVDRCDCGGCPGGLSCDANNGMCVEPGQLSSPTPSSPAAGRAADGATAGAAGSTPESTAVSDRAGVASEDGAMPVGCGCRLVATATPTRTRGWARLAASALALCTFACARRRRRTHGPA